MSSDDLVGGEILFTRIIIQILLFLSSISCSLSPIPQSRRILKKYLKYKPLDCSAVHWCFCFQSIFTSRRLGHRLVSFFQKGTFVKKGNFCFLVDCSFIICFVLNSNLTCKFCFQFLLAIFTCKFYF